jgi:hypothetical protein
MLKSVTVPIREVVRTRVEINNLKIQNGKFGPDTRREFTFVKKVASRNF